MINDQIQKQEGGDRSTNLQGQSIIINQGISYSDAKEIALDVYKSNFLQLSQDAAHIARARAEEITDKFLEKLQKENESALDSMKEPSMQAALYEAQKQYAKTGDKDLEDLLVDILVERASTPVRNIHQIVLDESLSVAPKLTPEQMDALTLNFLISKTQNSSLVSLENLRNYLSTHLIPFVDGLSEESSCYEHLEYAGCASLMHMGGILQIEEIFQKQYGGLFSKGFEQEKFETDIGEISAYAKLLTHCLHNTNLLQINAVNEDVIKNTCSTQGINEETQSKIINIFNQTSFSTSEIKDYIIEKAPETKKLFDLWKSSPLSKFALTTVGIAIAQANFRRKTGIKLNLSIWVK